MIIMTQCKNVPENSVFAMGLTEANVTVLVIWVTLILFSILGFWFCPEIYGVLRSEYIYGG